MNKLIIVLLFLISEAGAAWVGESCLPVFQQAISDYQASLGKDKFILISGFEKQSEDCQYAYGLGLVTAHLYLKQKILDEYYLDLWDLKRLENQTPPTKIHSLNKAVKSTQGLFQKRLNEAHLNSELLNHITPYDEQFDKYVAELIDSSMKQAEKSESPLLIGRHIFPPNGEGPFTLTVYKRKYPSEEIIYYPKGPATWPGTYIQYLEKLWELARSNAQSYLEWNPAAIFGENSFVYGELIEHGFLGKWSLIDSVEESPREVVEAAYFKIQSNIKNKVTALGADPTSFIQLEKTMLKFQLEKIKRDQRIYEVVELGLYAAPVILPAIVVGGKMIAIGGGLLEGAGFLGIGGYLATNSLNIAALSGLVSILKLGVIDSVEEWEISRQSGLNLPDHIILHLMGALPMTAFAPLATGVLTLSSASSVTALKGLWDGLGSAAHFYQAFGAKEFLKKIPSSVGDHILRPWINGWYKNPKVPLWFGVNRVSSFLFEYLMREVVSEDPNQKFILYDNKGEWSIHPEAIHNMSMGLFVDLLGLPFDGNHNFLMRYWPYRIIGLTTSPLSQKLTTGEVDHDLFLVDMVHTSLLLAPLGETKYIFRHSRFIAKLGKKSFFPLLALNLIMASGTTPAKIVLQKWYRDGGDPIEELKDLTKESQVDLAKFSEEDLNEALLLLRKNVHVFEQNEGNEIPLPLNPQNELIKFEIMEVLTQILGKEVSLEKIWGQIADKKP